MKVSTTSLFVNEVSKLKRTGEMAQLRRVLCRLLGHERNPLDPHGELDDHPHKLSSDPRTMVPPHVHTNRHGWEKLSNLAILPTVRTISQEVHISARKFMNLLSLKPRN